MQEPAQTPHTPEEPTSTGSLVGIVIILAVIIGGGIYYLFFRG